MANNDFQRQGGVFRTKQLPFTMILNNVLFDDNLSRDARLLYCMIQSKITIPDFTLYKTTLIKLFGANEKTFDKYWKELKDKGYLIQYKLTDENNRFYYEYDLLDTPDVELATKIHSQNNAKKDKKNHTPLFGGVEVLPGGKLGGFNKTDFNKTDSVVVDALHPTILNVKQYLNKKDLSNKMMNDLKDLIEKHGQELVNQAIEQADNQGGKSFKYLQHIMNEWKDKGIKTIDQVKENNLDHDKKRTEKKQRKSINNQSTVSNKVQKFNQMDSHDWDFDEIEKLEREYIDRKLSGN